MGRSLDQEKWTKISWLYKQQKLLPMNPMELARRMGLPMSQTARRLCHLPEHSLQRLHDNVKGNFAIGHGKVEGSDDYLWSYSMGMIQGGSDDG